MIEEKLDQLLRISDSNDMDYNPLEEVVEVDINKSEPEKFKEKVSDDDDDQMSVAQGTSMIA
jgi:hypothetical protein